jgi:hypothetical protein
VHGKRSRQAKGHVTLSAFAAGTRGLVSRWWAVLTHPSRRTFDEQQPMATWGTTWAGLVVLAVVEGVSLYVLLISPGSTAGVSSLPIGPKLHLPHAPLALALAAFVGSLAQFFLFSGLLWLSAHRFGGRGDFLTQTYLIMLGWVPLMLLSDVASLFATVGSVVGLLTRFYALFLLVPALASSHHLSLRRAWASLLVIVLAGLLLGVLVLAIFASRLGAIAVRYGPQVVVGCDQHCGVAQKVANDS